MSKIKGYIRYQRFSLEEILPFIGPRRHKFWIESEDKHVSVKCGGPRQLLWLQGTDCICCGLKGTHFWLEKNGYRSAHLNLYAEREDGGQTLMTFDHIIPRSQGGKKELSNGQLLCEKCNLKKKNRTISIEELRRQVLGQKSFQ